MKKFKKLIPAFCMLLISAVLMGTSTFAWFSMNKTVTATGMQVKARAEGGIVIKRAAAAADPAASVDFGSTTLNELYPTSTANATAWYHATAAAANASTAATGTLTTLNVTDVPPTSAGLGTGKVGTDSLYYVYDTITVSTETTGSTFADLWVSQCTVTGVNGDLSKALRVAFVCGSNVVICAPTESANVTYNVGTTPTSVTALGTSASGTTAMTKATGSAPSNVLVSSATQTVDVSVYVYFEGEDTNLKTDNLSATLDSLILTVKFECSNVTTN